MEDVLIGEERIMKFKRMCKWRQRERKEAKRKWLESWSYKQQGKIM